MNEHDVEKYILDRDEVTIPEVQAEFTLGYKEVRAIFSRLEKSGAIKFKESLTYVTCKNAIPVDFSFDDDDDDDDDALFSEDMFDDDEEDIDDKELYLRKKALKLCVQKNAASVSMLQRAFPIGYIKACKLIDWMESEGYISEAKGATPRRVLIDMAQFKKIYSPPTKETMDRFIDEVLADLNKNKSTPSDEGEQSCENKENGENKANSPAANKKPSWLESKDKKDTQAAKGEKSIRREINKKIINAAIDLAITYAEFERFSHAYAVYDTIDGEVPAGKAYKLALLFKNGDEWQFASDLFDSLADRKGKNKYIGMAAMEMGLHYEDLADESTGNEALALIYNANLNIALNYYKKALECGVQSARARIDGVNAKLQS